MGIKETYLNIIKAIYDKPTAKIILIVWIRNKKRMPTLATFLQHCIESPSQSNWAKERNKGIQIGKEEVNLSLFSDDIILYIKKTKDPISKLLELINKFSKVARYKINTQKSVVILCANNEIPEIKIKKTISFTINNKTIKYLGIHLTKKVKDLYNANHTFLLKEIEEDTNRERFVFMDQRN